MIWLAGLLLLVAAPAAAQTIHAYEYERVVVGTPISLTGPGSVTVRLQLPEEGTMLSPHLKGCETFGYPALVLDEDSVFILRNRHPDKGHVDVVIGDRHVGRTQWFCPRLPYIPRSEP